MKTRKQELAELDARITAARLEAEQTNDTRRRAQLERQISASSEARRLINERHDRQDATHQQQEAHQQQLVATQEARICAELRSRWPGDDASFSASYPALLEQYRMDRALGRAVPELKLQQTVTF